jgi:glycosidase
VPLYNAPMPIDMVVRQRLQERLRLLYGRRADECLSRLLALVRKYLPNMPPARKPTWDERDVLLITYGDQVRRPGESPLATLAGFLARAGLSELLSIVHLLPFFPYSSDDGFSVVDYRAVNPALGDWSDVAWLGRQYDLMFDLVLNHVSRESRWFEEYRAGHEPYARYFIEVDPQTDLSSVVRPRSLPLLTPVETSRGLRHVWSTFSDDQIDLSFAEPDVLLEMIDVLLFYLRQGARIVRLDAIAYLWKEIGTSCIHLPQTHAVVKLMRDVVDLVAPGALLLTETNVPHEENYSYFGRGDEAQMVYQFSFAPLMLEALLSGDATILAGWLADLEPPPPGCTVLSFTASHDGVGVRPLEGIMPPDRFDRLIDAVSARGGRIGTRRHADGTHSPYELSITYFSALGDPDAADRQLHVRRFLASQAMMLSLRGIPGIYFHSLVGTPNDVAGMERTGRARSINRRKFDAAELDELLADPAGTWAAVLGGYRRLLARRITEPAFHPDADQQAVETGDPGVVGLVRTSLDDRQRVLVLCNVAAEPREVDVLAAAGAPARADLLAEAGGGPSGERVAMSPYQVAWLVV